MARVICSCFFLLVLLAYQGDSIKPVPISQKSYSPQSIANKINSNPKAGWKAAVYPRFSNYSIEQSGHFFGLKATPQHVLDSAYNMKHPESDINLPEFFDAREAWPQCQSIGRILDQGHCGSCWAFAAVEVLMDRFCIHLNRDVSLSPNNLLSCCGVNCGNCESGYTNYAWDYLSRYGAVSEACDPYFDQQGCDHYNCQPEYPTPECVAECHTIEPWLASKHYASMSYRVNPTERDMMMELYKFGPFEVIIDAYEDFIFYRSGVYEHTHGSYAWGHIMKLIGWGTSEDGKPYWLVANSWNNYWGEDGFIRIRRGQNECGVETQPWAGFPSIFNLH